MYINQASFGNKKHLILTSEKRHPAFNTLHESKFIQNITESPCPTAQKYNTNSTKSSDTYRGQADIKDESRTLSGEVDNVNIIDNNNQELLKNSLLKIKNADIEKIDKWILTSIGTHPNFKFFKTMNKFTTKRNI